MNLPLEFRPARSWRPALVAGALLLALILLLFRDTAAAMVSIWIRSETFQHAFLVPPMVAWLVWRRRAVLAALTPQPMPWMLLPIAAVAFGWLLGELATVAAASQFAFVALIVLSVPALFGRAVTRVLAFPLLFLFFAVPFGEFAVPTLQKWTADATVRALQLTGIPVYQEGMQFVIPSGTWSVVAACSGVRYLIACVMVGTLYAYLNYRSTRRRILFVLISIAVPILANWVRAYTIVMIGHLTGSPMILGVEHTTYGWILFGVIVLAMFVLAARWAEPEDEPTVPTPAPATAGQPAGYGRGWITAAGMALLLVVVQVWAGRLAAAVPDWTPQLGLPAGQGAWQVTDDAPALAWPPGIANPSATAARQYRSGDRTVTVWVGYFARQDEQRKLVTSSHRIVRPDSDWRGRLTGPRRTDGGLPGFETAIVSRGSTPTLARTEQDRVWMAYWLGGRWIVKPWQVKLLQAGQRLLGRADDGAVLLLMTPWDEGADAALAAFAGAHLEALSAALTAARPNP